MWFFVAFLVSVVVGIALRPNLPDQNVQPEDFETPKTGEGDKVPVLFGTRELPAPHVVWYGDLRTVAIRTKGGKK